MNENRMPIAGIVDFVRCGPSYMHRCRAFPLRYLGFLA